MRNLNKAEWNYVYLLALNQLQAFHNELYLKMSHVGEVKYDHDTIISCLNIVKIASHEGDVGFGNKTVNDVEELLKDLNDW